MSEVLAQGETNTPKGRNKAGNRPFARECDIQKRGNFQSVLKMNYSTENAGTGDRHMENRSLSLWGREGSLTITFVVISMCAFRTRKTFIRPQKSIEAKQPFLDQTRSGRIHSGEYLHHIFRQNTKNFHGERNTW